MTFVDKQRTPPPGVVCGYLRLSGVPVRRAVGLRAALDDYCVQNGLRLAAVCTERVQPTCGRTIAFTALLDIIAIGQVVGVVMPSPMHLGPAKVAAVREQQIRAAGGDVFFVRGRLHTPARPLGALQSE